MRELRLAANLSQTELARLVGEKQQNVAYWEQSDRPPRSDVLPKMAKVLGVSVEELLGESTKKRKGGPKGRVKVLFEEVSTLPRRQQDKIVEFLTPLVQQYKRDAG